MSEIGEGLGSAVEGGMLARAVEPRRGEDAQPEGPQTCANCGAENIAAYCYRCGQKAHVHRSISGILHELLHGVLHLDGKIWQTLPLLTFRPGQLTRRYIDGERAKFVSPMAMFLFGVFVMFAVFQMVGISAPTDLQGDTERQLRDLAREQVAQLEERRDLVAEQIADDTLPDDRRQQLRQEREGLDEQLASIRQAQEELPILGGLAEQPREASGAGTGEEDETVIGLDDDGTARMTIGTSDVAFIDDALDKWRKNPGLMLYKLQTNAYKFSWLLIPLSIPIVWLLFAWKRRFKAYDHAIFVTYSLSFMTLLFIALSLLAAAGIGGGWVFLALLFVPPLHIYKQLRGTYELSRFAALWRLALLTVGIVFTITLFLQLLLVLGAF